MEDGRLLFPFSISHFPFAPFAAFAAIAAAAAIPAVLLYVHTLGFGFDYDDYHFVRPFTHGEIAAAFRGPWDSSGIELPYYRPLTIAMFAARFAWFGINSRACHAASIAAFALAAAVAGWVAWSLTGRRLAGAATAAAFAVHPAMPYALVSWVTNQMHLLEVLVILLALGWWNAIRARSFPWWSPLWLLAAAAFLVKEDGVMLLPVILVLHWVRRRVAEPSLRPVPVAFTAGSVVLVASLLAARGWALAGTAGRTLPSIAQAFTNYASGLNHVFRLVPADRPWQPAASWFATLLPVAGLLMARRTSPGVRCGIVSGIVIAAGFNLPFIFVTKGEQMHVVACGAAIVLGSAVVAVLDALRRPMLKSAGAIVIVAGLSSFAAVSRDISGDFRPFGPIVLSHDAIVRTWAAVPEEIREYLAGKVRTGASAVREANPALALSQVTFGVHATETSSEGTPYRWMAGPRADILVNGSARAVTIPLRHEIGAFREPADVAIAADGRTLDRIKLADGAWRYSRLALSPGRVSLLSRMHRITVTIDHAWVPAAVIPGSTDSRTLGLKIGEVDLR